jgi:hypothetical protein
MRASIMNSKFTRFFSIVGITSVFITASAAVPPNMEKWAGTWTLNVQKSQYGDEKPPADPTAIKQILRIRVSEKTLDLYFRTETADGTDVADESHLLDLTGNPHATEFGGFKGVTETFKQLDANTVEITLKARPAGSSDIAPGELTIKVRLTMSADGKTIRETKEYHYTETGKNPGSDRNPAEGSILVFDRQPPTR